MERLGRILNNNRISDLALQLVVFLLPVSRELFVISLWPWILSIFIETIYQRGANWYSLRKLTYPVYFLLLLFFLMSISLCWTTNRPEGFEQLGRSVIYILFPVLFTLKKPWSNRKKQFTDLLKSYVLGVILSLVVLILSATFNSINFQGDSIQFNPWISEWEHAYLYENFSFLIHPTYFGMMVLMAASICLFEIKQKNIFSKHMFIPAILSLFLLACIVLISSRIIILASILIILWYLSSRIVRKSVRLVIIASVLILLALLTRMHPRFNDLISTSKDGSQRLENLILEKDDRVKTWLASYQLIKKNLLWGVGIGDVKDELTNFYLSKHYFESSSKYLNSHNQFFETWLGVGLFGFILILVILLYPLVSGKYINLELFGSFFIIMFTVFMSESVLSRLWGVAFFTIFYIVLSQKQSNRSFKGKSDQAFEARYENTFFL